jgi:hypothetical protein
MATPSATLNAPKSIDDLKQLLRDDFKVKVAGQPSSCQLRKPDVHILLQA